MFRVESFAFIRSRELRRLTGAAKIFERGFEEPCNNDAQTVDALIVPMHVDARVLQELQLTVFGLPNGLGSSNSSRMGATRSVPLCVRTRVANDGSGPCKLRSAGLLKSFKNAGSLLQPASTRSPRDLMRLRGEAGGCSRSPISFRTSGRDNPVFTQFWRCSAAVGWRFDPQHARPERRRVWQSR